MIKNRFVQLFGRIAILCAFVVTTVISVGATSPKPNFYVYYTNLSNYFCLIVVFAEIIGTALKISRNGTKGFGDISAGLKFAALIDILVTFLITNILLQDITSAAYWSDLYNVMFHFVCPILFWLDWILFSKHANTRWFYPLLVTIFPLIYIAYILIRGFILENVVIAADWQVIYPYFFLNVPELGYLGVALWVFALCGAFVAFSYLICILDNIPNYKRMAEEHKLKKIAKKQAKANFKQEKIEAKKAKKEAIAAEKQAKIDKLTAEIQEQLNAKQQAKIDAKQAKVDAKQAKKIEKKVKKASKKA